LSDKISKQGSGSPSLLRNVEVKEVVIGLSHMAFLLEVKFYDINVKGFAICFWLVGECDIF